MGWDGTERKRHLFSAEAIRLLATVKNWSTDMVRMALSWWCKSTVAVCILAAILGIKGLLLPISLSLAKELRFVEVHGGKEKDNEFKSYGKYIGETPRRKPFKMQF